MSTHPALTLLDAKLQPTVDKVIDNWWSGDSSEPLSFGPILVQVDPRGGYKISSPRTATLYGLSLSELKQVLPPLAREYRLPR